MANDSPIFRHLSIQYQRIQGAFPSQLYLGTAQLQRSVVSFPCQSRPQSSSLGRSEALVTRMVSLPDEFSNIFNGGAEMV